MASEQTFSTGDLRSRAQEYKRDSETKQKWANGESWGPGRQITAHARPAKLIPRSDRLCNRVDVGTLTHSRYRQKRSNKELGVKDAVLSQRREIVDNQCTSSDSSADEEVVEPSAAPEPDAEITYSYDASRGPNHGSQILSLAVAKAVERYENTVTDKLVQNEYEMLDEAGEVVPNRACKKCQKRDAATDEEEFVLV